MDITIPIVLKTLSSAGTAVKEMTAWWKKTKGDSRSLIGELKVNLTYLDLVAEEDVDLGDVIEKISICEYKRLSDEGFSFNMLKRGKISKHPSLEDTHLSSWHGKDTEALVESIYAKITDLKIRFPLVKENEKYRWKVRVINIRKRIWLLLIHVRS